MSDTTIQVLSVQEVLDDMGYDIADEVVKRNITRAIIFADAYLKGSIGEKYPVEDPRSKELALMIVNDVYDNKGLKDTMSGNTRKLVDDISLQLRLELRRGSNE